MKARRLIAAAALLAVVAVTPADALAAPATKEYTPRVPSSKGKEEPSGASTPSAPVAPAVPGPATPREQAASPQRPEISTTVDLGEEDRSWAAALLDALLDPLVMAVALASLAIAAAAVRLRPAG